MDRFKVLRVGAVLAVAAGLAGCGSDDVPAGADRNAAAASPSPSTSPGRAAGNASAAEVAKESRGKLKCPARIKTAAREAGAPVDDILGVRPGLTYEEAESVVLCSHDLLVASADNSRGFQIGTHGKRLRQGFEARFARDRVQKSPKEIMAEMQDAAIARGMNRATGSGVNPGEAKWYVGTMGLPGEERVIVVEREEWFAEGRNPTVASVADAFVKKYGQPAYVHDSGSGPLMAWAYDPFGRPITETSPRYNCAAFANPFANLSLNPECGLVVAAYVSALRENSEIAQSIQVRSVDEAAGYELLNATEQALEQAEVQRRADQTRQASENADVPQL